MNLDGITRSGDGWSDIQDANKLELKALGLVTGIEKIPLSSVRLQFVEPQRWG